MRDNRLPRPRLAKVGMGVLASSLMMIALTCWALSSPVGSSPDDDFHLASIWCSASAGGCGAGETSGTRAVPAELVGQSICYTTFAEQSASCQEADLTIASGDTANSGRGNFYGLYPEVFYWAMGLLASPQFGVSVVAMRIFNSAVFVGLVGGLAALLPARHRASLLASVAITVVPLGLFLVPSTNPSSWAITSAAVVLFSTVAFFETLGRRKWAFAGFALAAAAIGGGARADSAVFVGISVVAALVLAYRPDRRSLRDLWLPVVLVAVSLYFYMSSSQGGAAASGGLTRGLEPEPFGRLLFINGMNVPELWVGAFGGFALGWFDTPMPAIVWVFSAGIFAAAVFAGMKLRQRGKSLAASALALVLYFYPLYLLVSSGAYVGEYIQPRYILPLLTMFAAILLMTSDRLRFSRAQVITAIAALSIANSVALHTNIRRYVTGLDIKGWNLNTAVEWWWNMPVSPMLVWAFGSAAFCAALIVVTIQLTRKAVPLELAQVTR